MTDYYFKLAVQQKSLSEREECISDEFSLWECGDCNKTWQRKSVYKDGIFHHCPECYGTCVKIGEENGK